MFEFTSSYAKKEDLYTDQYIYRRVLRKLTVTRSGESAGLVLIFTSQAVFHTLEIELDMSRCFNWLVQEMLPIAFGTMQCKWQISVHQGEENPIGPASRNHRPKCFESMKGLKIRLGTLRKSSAN